MGAKATVLFFIAKVQTELFNRCAIKPICWKRYVDDIFYLLDTRREQITHFIEQGNNYHATIKSGGGCLQGNWLFSPPASMTSHLASVTFNMASKVFIEETDRNFEFITEILFRFLGLDILRSPLS